MNQKYKKYTKRFEDLIEFYENEIKPKRKLVRTYHRSDNYYTYDKENLDLVQKWLINAENILEIVFGKDSLQLKTFDSIRKNEKTKFANKVHKIKGLLEGAKEDIENGFLLGQEFIIANEVFDSVLEEAKFFIFEQKNKDIGAILLRIVLEAAIKRIAKKEGIDIEGKKISALNDELKMNNIFMQTIWRQNQAWLDIGNDAAHGNFKNYDLKQVENFHQGLVNFLSAHFN
jgi:hypothetical protein